MAEEIKEIIPEKKEEVATQNETSVKNVAQNNKVSVSNDVYGSTYDFENAYRMAKAMASSTILPATFQKNEANCMLAVAQAKKLGIDPITVANNLYLIQGKMSWKSEFLIAMINASGKFDMELNYEEEEKDGKPYSCKCWTMRDGRVIEGIKVTMDMAEKEGWTKKNGSKWNTIPQIMLRYRSASFFARFSCPELTSGMYTKEEYEDNDFSYTHSKKGSASLNDLLDESDIIEGEIID